jgi:hypothetical protein
MCVNHALVILHADVAQSAFSLCGDLVGKGAGFQLFCNGSVNVTLAGATLATRVDTNTNLTTSALCSMLPPIIPFFFQLCLQNMTIEKATQFPRITSNAVWALGEACVTFDPGIFLTLGPILANHTALLLNQSMNPSSSLNKAGLVWEEGALALLKQNICITLGR